MLSSARVTALAALVTCVASMLQLAPLPFAYDALEPYIDAATMALHHTRHLQTYLDRKNAVMMAMRASGDAKAHDLVKRGLDHVLLHLDEVADPEQRQALRNSGGGVVNHEAYFSTLSPPAPAGQGGVANPSLEVIAALQRSFGSFDLFKERMRGAALAVFGSGWAWLELDTRQSPPGLNVTTTSNQDSPAMVAGRAILLPLDVWEHAYCEADDTRPRVMRAARWRTPIVVVPLRAAAD